MEPAGPTTQFVPACQLRYGCYREMTHAGGEATPSVMQELPSVSAEQRRLLLTDLLRRVSRSFYLTVRVLPSGMREPVGVAYLLARAADTIADATLLSPSERLVQLLAFRSQLEGTPAAGMLDDIRRSVVGRQVSADEQTLLESLPGAFSLLQGLSEADRDEVRSIVVTLTRGMEIDLTTFPPEESGKIRALKDTSELDRYIYYVAGCVGEFWTAVGMAHTPALSAWDRGRMVEVGVRVGKALQMTNVLRDVPRDLRVGRCYLPEDGLTELGLSPGDLLDASKSARARPAFAANIERALEHYIAAEEYVLSIPRRCLRLRLAALWPILIGLATLGKLAHSEAWLDPARPVKVGRGWVYRMMAASVLCAPFNWIVRSWISRLRRRVRRALQ